MQVQYCPVSSSMNLSGSPGILRSSIAGRRWPFQIDMTLTGSICWAQPSQLVGLNQGLEMQF